MIDDALPGDGLSDEFRPDDFRPPKDGGIPISADFVSRTFARVREDQAQIRYEAAQVEEIQVPRALLGAYRVPAPSPGFVDRALDRVRSERQLDERELQRLLATYGAPSVSADFVERTLDSLRVESPARGLRRVPAVRVRGEAPAAMVSAAPRRWTFAAAAAALLVAIGFLIFGGGSRGSIDGERTATTPVVASSQDYTPVALGTTMSRAGERTERGLRFEPVDGLLLLASIAGGRSE